MVDSRDAVKPIVHARTLSKCLEILRVPVSGLPRVRRPNAKLGRTLCPTRKRSADLTGETVWAAARQAATLLGNHLMVNWYIGPSTNLAHRGTHSGCDPQCGASAVLPRGLAIRAGAASGIKPFGTTAEA